MTLYIDSREPIQIINELKKQVDKVVVKRFDSGDYMFNDVGVERKELRDLLQSLHNGRYFKQVRHLKENYAKPLVLYEGDIDNTTLVRFIKSGRKRSKRLLVLDESEKKQIRETQHGTLFGWGVPILQSTSLADTVTRIVELYNRELGFKTSVVPSPVVKKSQEVGEIKYLMLNCINGIGPTLAKQVLKTAPSFNTLVDIGAKQLAKDIKGLTLGKASLLVEAIK